VIGAVAAVLVILGAVLVLQARSEDGDVVPGAAWSELPVPRAARVDDFPKSGPLGAVDGFGTWETGTGGLQVSGGVLRSSDGGGTATVDAGSTDVLVHAQFVRVAVGSGLLVSSTADGSAGLVLRSAGPGTWELVWQRSGPPPQTLQAFAAPTADVSVQVIRRGSEVTVAFDEQIVAVDVPPETAMGTFVGVTTNGPGTEIDLFGYLPLAAR
jgi:hypothetical protein